MGQICPTVFLHFMTFLPRLETNDALQCSSDSFPRMVIYNLCVENKTALGTPGLLNIKKLGTLRDLGDLTLLLTVP